MNTTDNWRREVDHEMNGLNEYFPYAILCFVIFYDFHLAFEVRFLDTDKLFAYRAVSRSFLSM